MELLEAAYLIRIKMEIKTRVKKTVAADLTITDVFDPAKQTAEDSMQKLQVHAEGVELLLHT